MADEKTKRVPSKATLTTRAFGRVQQAKHALEYALSAQSASARKHAENVAKEEANVKAAESALSALTGSGG